MIFAINPWVAIGVLASTAATDAAYVFFNAAVSSRRRVWAANWSSIWYMLSAFVEMIMGRWHYAKTDVVAAPNVYPITKSEDRKTKNV